MKIFSAAQIHRADAYTIQHEPVSSRNLMERAANSFCAWFEDTFPRTQPIYIFCGTGNNGGDGLAIARMLHIDQYAVHVYVLRGGKPSVDFTANENRVGVPIKDIDDISPEIPVDAIVIDALFGTGLSRPLVGKAKELVEYLNDSAGIKVAVDIPSGLYADKLSDSVQFMADHTFTFETPKLSFLLPLKEEVVGELHIGEIRLHPDFIQSEPTDNYYLTANDIQLKKRQRYSHKGTFGHALIVAGSYGKIGAAILASKACLYSGAGLVSLYTAECGYMAVQGSVPEVMVMTSAEKSITKAMDIDKYNAVGIGPGIGTHKLTADALHGFIKTSKHPMVLDADALNILSENQAWLNDLPKDTILTPHPKEFERIFGLVADPFAKLELLREKAQEHHLYIVLKGANTAIACPDGEVWFNSTGNAGMATGGTGDVLTGIITSLLAQGYEPKDAARYGVFLHGLAGDITAEETGMEALVAGDIPNHLGKAFLALGKR